MIAAPLGDASAVDHVTSGSVKRRRRPPTPSTSGHP